MSYNLDSISNPLISIITVVYNNEEFIEQCIQSVISQEYKNIEYIIIDGGSTDNTLKIIEKYKDKINTLISKKDNGIYDAFNKGIKVCKGKYVGFLNSDDYFYSSKSVSLISSVFKKNMVNVVFSNIQIIERHKNYQIRSINSKNFNLFKFRLGIAPPHPTFYCSKEMYSKVGLYSTNYGVSADYEMMLRILYTQKASYVHLNAITVIMRSGGISNRNIYTQIKQNFEILKAAKKNNLYTNIFFIIAKLPIRLFEIFRAKVE